jgi:hypothetical protein
MADTTPLPQAREADLWNEAGDGLWHLDSWPEALSDLWSEEKPTLYVSRAPRLLALQARRYRPVVPQ